MDIKLQFVFLCLTMCYGQPSRSTNIFLLFNIANCFNLGYLPKVWNKSLPAGSLSWKVIPRIRSGGLERTKQGRRTSQPVVCFQPDQNCGKVRFLRSSVEHISQLFAEGSKEKPRGDWFLLPSGQDMPRALFDFKFSPVLEWLHSYKCLKC